MNVGVEHLNTESKQKKDKTVSIALYIALIITILTLGWLIYSRFQLKWNPIETMVTQKNAVEEENGSDSKEEKAYMSAESQLYSEKFEEAKTKIETLARTDYIVVVDVSEQREYVFRKDGTFEKKYRIATGGSYVYAGTEVNEIGESVAKYENRSMGESVWRISDKRDSNLDSIYGLRLMILERQIGGLWIQTDVALHGTEEAELLGTPSSLGCIYHDNADIIELYDMLEIGTLVVSIK